MSGAVAPKGPTPGFLVWRLAMKWRAAVDRAVAPLGLTHAQYTVLASLHGMRRSGRRPSQRELADHLGLEPLYISKLARTLEAGGLLERAADPADTRAVRLALTEEGAETARRAISVVHRLLDQLLEPLGGSHGPRTEALTAELTTLLAAPLGLPDTSDAPPPGRSSPRETP
jgi:DNA-binding MarR family transcriptional regulator